MRRKITGRTATAFIFSGRPNPQWQLSEEQMKEWKEQCDKLTLTDKEVQRPSILGYTGCLLQNNQHSYWIIYNSCVSFYGDDMVINKKDTNREMERLLLNTMPAEMKEAMPSLNF